jgi:hypothetical protein
MKPGDIVILLETGQAGTIEWLSSDLVCVHTRNGEIWTGPVGAVHPNPTAEEQSVAIIEPERKVSPTMKKGGRRK